MTQAHGDALLSVRDLSVTFDTRRGPFQAVRGISFDVGRERVGIVGESGSGKSMTGRAILGLVRAPGRVAASRLTFDGIDMRNLPERQMRRIRGQRVSMVMQDPRYSLNPVMTVGRQIAEALRVHGRPPRDEIRLDHVSWRFPGESREAVSDCSLTLRAGELTVLVGPSGAGKSTLADIVMGLLEPQKGAVLVDGAALRPGQLRRWRDRTGYVAQEPFMINGTIRENMAIAAGGPVDDERILRALDLASAGFVRNLPAGLDTTMGDRGALLSGGERQRIAVARALLREPDILVLDEATSALDWENEEALIRAIDGLRGRMTILAITHRPALSRAADAVFVMEAGRVVASERPRERGMQAEGYLGRMTS